MALKTVHISNWKGVAIKAVDDVLRDSASVLVTIAGGTATGKTTIVAEGLRAHYEPDAMLISLDDYFKGRAFVEGEVRHGIDMNRDHPDYVDLERASIDFASLKRGNAVQKPHYSMQESRRTGYVEVQPASVVLVEGIYALHETLVNLADVKIFVRSTKENMRERRFGRARLIEGHTMEGEMRYFDDVAMRMHDEHVAPTERNADIVIIN